MDKGDVVLCTAQVMTEYETDSKPGWLLLHKPNHMGNNLRCLYTYKYKEPVQVILLGKTSIKTGSRHDAVNYIDDYDPPYLVADKHHKVWVATLHREGDNRYYKPIYVLESDVLLKE